MTIHQVLESLIFASPKPISTGELVAALKATGESSEKPEAQEFSQPEEGHILMVLTELQQQIDEAGRAFQLVEQSNGWAFVSRPDYAPWVRQLFPEAKPTRLSGPALETLAIIAYRQPVTRADIEAVRGVAVDGVMQVLLDRSLVRISGRADVPGRPLLYSTTGYFLEHFGLKSVHELPNADELRRVELPKAPPPEEKPPSKKKGAPKDGAGAQPAAESGGAGDSDPASSQAAFDFGAVSPGENPADGTGDVSDVSDVLVVDEGIGDESGAVEESGRGSGSAEKGVSDFSADQEQAFDSGGVPEENSPSHEPS